MSSPEQTAKRQYVNFAFYKLDPAWRRLPEDERTKGKQEFIRAIEDYSGKVLVIAYTTVGIRGERSSLADSHVFRVECLGPDGKPVPHYSGNVVATGGASARSIPLATTDPAGKWTVRVTDILSGQSQSASFDVH